MASRRAPMRARSFPTMRSPSGPRWASERAMAARQSGCLSGAPVRETTPKMPHIRAAPVAGARAVRRVVAVGEQQRQRRERRLARPGPRRGSTNTVGSGQRASRSRHASAGEQGRAGDGAVVVGVVRDEVAGELAGVGGRDGERLARGRRAATAGRRRRRRRAPVPDRRGQGVGGAVVAHGPQQTRDGEGERDHHDGVSGGGEAEARAAGAPAPRAPPRRAAPRRAPGPRRESPRARPP